MALPYVTAYLVARPHEAFPIDHPYIVILLACLHF